jgi:peptidoglycan hydrolase-like protein with peptidoglycan-binding domain
MRRPVLAGGLVGSGALVAAGIALAGGDGSPPAQASPSSATGATAQVERRDLVDRDTVDGTLGYAGGGSLTAGAAGTLTGLRAAGAVVRRGERLYDVDGAPAAFLLHGRLPAWRDLGPGVVDGEDVRQLERNLRALGDDPYDALDVDDHWDAATTAAVKRFQDARGLTEDGSLSKGQVVFRRGPTRIGQRRSAIGDQLSPGRPLADLSSTRRQVTVKLEATRQALARTGDRVTVELPIGRTARGRITDVGEVAEKGSGQDAVPTVDVTIALRGRAARGTGLDQAPVDVGFAVEKRRHVLAVPVKALLAREGGGFAVQVLDGGGAKPRTVAVHPGLYVDDFVEVEGAVREGERVVTAR